MFARHDENRHRAKSVSAPSGLASRGLSVAESPGRGRLPAAIDPPTGMIRVKAPRIGLVSLSPWLPRRL
jgi:hypothetical protein